MEEMQDCLCRNINDLSLNSQRNLENVEQQLENSTDIKVPEKETICITKSINKEHQKILSKDIKSEIKDLSLKECLTEETVTDQIAKNLNESNRELIHKIVKAIGIEQALKFYDETRRIEQSGGIYCNDGTRRKKPGGVFFYLINHDKSIVDYNIKKIFAEESHKKYKQRKDQVKEERKKRTEQLRARIIQEGLLYLENQKKDD